MFEIGADSGRYYSLNVPLREGIDDPSMFYFEYTLKYPSNKIFWKSQMSLRVRKPTIWVSDQAGHKPVCTVTEAC